jgi:predicted nucleotide-binding protein
MARRSSEPPSRHLTPAKTREAIARLEARIGEIEKLDTSTIQTGDDPSVQGLEAKIKSTIANIYGEGTAEYRRLEIASNLDATTYVLSLVGGQRTPPGEIREGVERGKARALAILKGETHSLKESLEFGDAESPPEVKPRPAVRNNDIFIVHGRDDTAKTEVARVIERAGLKAVILHEQPNRGATIIEKFEKHGAAVGFAVVVVTPDDVGGPLAAKPDDFGEPSSANLRHRARQNVIGEMFWFAGRLGRENVCVLVKGDDIEMPSDVAGIGYTPMDTNGAWKPKLLGELDAAGHKDLKWKEALA